MTSLPLLHFLQGATAAACCVVALFFWRFWRSSGDRLFFYFSLGFWTFSLNWLGLVLINPGDESRHLVYILRLLASLLIIAGILDKNRRAKRG